MIKNYWKIIWRYQMKNKAGFFINVIGLATGMAITLLIGLWVTDELTFDHYFTNHSRIGLAMITQKGKENSWTGDVLSTPMSQALHDQYPDLFKRVAAAYDNNPHLFNTGDKKINATSLWAQSTLPEMFTFKMLEGSANAGKDPSTAIISQSLAKSLYGSDDPMGKTFRLDNKVALSVGGVYEDLPENTTFYGTQAILPWDNQEISFHTHNTDWDNHSGQTFVELAPNVTVDQVNARIKNLPTAHITGWEETGLIQALDKSHLYDDFENGVAVGGRIRYVKLFVIIGLFVLLLACINFMNLSTARSEKRAREVGIRKTVGSLKRQLIALFLSESILIALLSFALSILLVIGSLPFFNTLAAKHMTMPWDSWQFWSLTFFFTLLTGCLAGSYPAFYLSRFDPVKVLKGTFRVGPYAALPRKILVVLQFSVSLTLIIGTIIVYKQVQYAESRPVGYNRAGLLTVNINTPDLKDHYEALRQELMEKNIVENVAASSMSVTGFWNSNQVDWRGKRLDQASIFFRNITISPDFGKTVGWEVIQGRDFSRDFPTDSNAMLLNETAVKTIGLPHPIGEKMTLFGKSYTVVGVVNDMLTNQPYYRIQPAVFVQDGWKSVITMRIPAGRSAHAALQAMAPVFAKYDPSSPFDYAFVDEAYAHKFEDEVRLSYLATVFTSLAIFISCLGLFGLASFVAGQRIKEISIRKVLGASTPNLWSLLSREFIGLVAISLVIAIPIAYSCMKIWLQNYTYHTDLSWWVFASAGVGIILVTLPYRQLSNVKSSYGQPGKNIAIGIDIK